jgi:hypothetical protein
LREACVRHQTGQRRQTVAVFRANSGRLEAHYPSCWSRPRRGSPSQTVQCAGRGTDSLVAILGPPCSCQPIGKPTEPRSDRLACAHQRAGAIANLRRGVRAERLYGALFARRGGHSGVGISTLCRSVQSGRQSGEIVRQIGELINEDYVDVDLFVARGRRVSGICCQEEPPPLDRASSGPCCFSISGICISRASADRSTLRRVQRHAHHVPGLSWALNQSRRCAPSYGGGSARADRFRRR